MEISVIVPIYNNEKYIKRCVASILQQTFTDFSLLLIDDGSTDSSLDIIQNLEGQDSRISVLTKQNEGAATARNFGLEHASGKYVAFIDADDFVEKDYLATLYQNAEKSNADISVCSMDWIFETGASVKKVNQKRVYSAEEYITAVLDGAVDYITAFGPCGKLYRRSLLTVNNIRFPQDYKLSEDRIFNVAVMRYMQGAASCDKIGYHYDQTNTSSLTHNRKSFNTVLNILQAEIAFWNEYQKTLVEKELFLEVGEKYCQNRLNAFLSMDYLIATSDSSRKQKADLYGLLPSLLPVEDLRRLHKGGAFKVLEFALDTASLGLMRQWLFVMRTRQKLKKK